MSNNLHTPTSLEELDTIFTNNSSNSIIVDCFAQWCAPCKIIAPIFQKLSLEYPNVVFIKVDVETFPTFAAEHSIRNIPTMLVFKQGKYTSRQTGFTSEQKLHDFIDINS